MRLLESILALSQLLALVLIGYAILAPFYWSGSKSDLEAAIHRGGDHAAAQWLSTEQREAQSVRRWGIGIGVTNFALATMAIVASRRRKTHEAKNRTEQDVAHDG